MNCRCGKLPPLQLVQQGQITRRPPEPKTGAAPKNRTIQARMFRACRILHEDLRLTFALQTGVDVHWRDCHRNRSYVFGHFQILKRSRLAESPPVCAKTSLAASKLSTATSGRVKRLTRPSSACTMPVLAVQEARHAIGGPVREDHAAFLRRRSTFTIITGFGNITIKSGIARKCIRSLHCCECGDTQTAPLSAS